jgi:hypothetical protein
MRHRRRHAKTPPSHPIPHQKSKTFPLLKTTVALWLGERRFSGFKFQQVLT